MDHDSASTGSAHADEQDEQAMMAQAMGFASFGAQHPNKKRRYNPRADAVGVSLPPKPSATGANSTALGAGPTTGSNANEISLDDDEEEEVAPVPAQVRPASLPQRPAVPSGGFATSHEPRRGQDHPQRGNWYEGYYDPSSNENPWGRIEKARDMSSVGPWLLRGVGGGDPPAAGPVA